MPQTLLSQERAVRVVTGCCVALFCLGGCRAARSCASEYASTRALCVAHRSSEADALWTAAKDVLRDHRFRLDRVDRQAGIITTLPLTSRQFFEFWRSDVCTSADAWEATLNPIRRWVEVRFSSRDDDDWKELTVIVHKERLSSYDRQFNSTGASYQVFGSQLPAATGSKRLTSDGDRWLDLGIDHALEDRLAGHILERAGFDSAEVESAGTHEHTSTSN